MVTKKIFQICFGDGYAGSAKMALQNSFYLAKKGYEIYFFVSKGSLTEKRSLDYGLTTISIDTKNQENVFAEVNKKFLEFNPDFVICNHSLDRKIGLKLRLKHGKSFTNIAYRHNMTESFPVIGSFIYNFFFDFSIACSNGVAKSLTKSGIFKSKVKTVHYGIEIPDDVNSQTGTLVREKYNFKDKIVIGNSAWFHKERKGFDILFKAFSALDENHVLMVIGIPQEKQDEVFAYAKELGINKDRIVLPGYVDNVWEYYKAMDIFVFPSRSEGFPIAPLEAAAAGLPIIASDIPGSNEFIFNEKTGLLFNVNNPEELVNGIKKLTLNKEYSNKLAIAANTLVNQEYTAEKYAERLIKIL